MEFLKKKSVSKYLEWILVIVVVLVILFVMSDLSANNGFNPGGCTPQAEYTCSAPSYNSRTGNISIWIGQDTGKNWTDANVIFLNISNIELFNATGSFPLMIPTNAIGIIESGTKISITLPVSSSTSTLVGASVSGQIWARYVSSNTTHYSEIAEIFAKAT